MTEAAALQILQLDIKPPVDDLREIAEDQLFDLRDYFLRNPVIRELYENRIARIERIATATETLGYSFGQNQPPEIPKVDFSSLDLSELLRQFEQSLAMARLVLSSTLHPIVLTETCTSMIALQTSFEAQFIKLTAHISPYDGAVRAAEHVDTGRLLRALSSGYRPDAELLISKERRRILNRLARQADR